MFIYVTFLLMSLPVFHDAFADTTQLQEILNRLSAKSDGRVGVCVFGGGASNPVCVKGDEPFPLQSVMKLLVAATVFDLADRSELRVKEKLIITPQDASPGPQEFANLVKSRGSLPVRIEELVTRAIIDSDSTSIDVLIKHIGGIEVVQKFLLEKKIEGVRIDRNERDLQAESVGLAWLPEFSDPIKFDGAISLLPEIERDEAWRVHLRDLRDTATPVGMARFLKRLAASELLSEVSTQRLLSIMEGTKTGSDRLRAGIPENWSIAHKTGTGREWKGVTSATNDVGVLTAPDGGKVAVSVFVAESRRSSDERAALIASVAKAVTGAYSRKVKSKKD